MQSCHHFTPSSSLLLLHLFHLSALPHTQALLQHQIQSLPQDSTGDNNKGSLDMGQLNGTDLENEDWVLDEESVLTTAAGKPGVRGWSESVGGLWWIVMSPEDPADGVEPARWDGVRTKDELLHEGYTLGYQEYEVLQEGWVEQAVT